MSNFEITKPKGETRRLNAIVAYETWMLIRSYAEKSNLSIGEVIAEAISFWQLQEQQFSNDSILEMAKLVRSIQERNNLTSNDSVVAENRVEYVETLPFDRQLSSSVLDSYELVAQTQEEQYKDPALCADLGNELDNKAQLDVLAKRLMVVERMLAGFEDVRVAIAGVAHPAIPTNQVIRAARPRNDENKQAHSPAISGRQKRRGRRINLDT